ncbi:MAG: ArnT family glycosyltransferase [Myxococcota bacterium]
MKLIYYYLIIVSCWSIVLINPDGFLYEDDEGAYLYISSALSEGHSLYSDVLAAKPPLLFYVGAILYKVFGNNIIAFRYFASFLGLISVLLIFGIFRNFLGNFIALISSLLFLFDPLIFTQMRLFRTDILMLTSLIAEIYFILKLRNNYHLILIMLFTFLAIFSRDDAFIYSTFIILFFTISRRDKRLILPLLFAAFTFIISILLRGQAQIVGSFSQQLNPDDFNIVQKSERFIEFVKYLVKKYPIWLLFPLITLPVIIIKRGNNFVFSSLLILLNLIVIFLSDSHYIRYVQITVIARIFLIGEFLNTFRERFRYILGSIILSAQLLINPFPAFQLRFEEPIVKEISNYINSIAKRDDILLSDYGYFNFHSGLKGTSISGYISGGNVRTGEINSERLINVIESEAVKYLLIHSDGRLYYPYGCELYYYEPHHIKGIRDYGGFMNYVQQHFDLMRRFESPKGPIFNLYIRRDGR